MADADGREWVHGQQLCARCRAPITDPHNAPDGSDALCRACGDTDPLGDPDLAATLDLDLTQPGVRAVLGLYRELKRW